MTTDPGFIRIRRELKSNANGSVVDAQELLSNTFESLGYGNPTEVITEPIMTEALSRIGITFSPDDVAPFLSMCVNPETKEVHNYDVYRAIEIVEQQRIKQVDSKLTPMSLLNMRTSVDSPSPRKRPMSAAIPQKMEVDEHDIEDFLGESYIENNNANRLSSNALDVLALYIKGQKLLYTESKTYCEQQLNFLMLPAIFIACVGSIFSFLSGRYNNGDLIIASLNGFNAFLLSLISYLKLDAKAQAHKTSAYKFDKLESMCEFNSAKFMFFDTTKLDIMDVVKQIEKDVKEVKETNQFILPESIRYEFNFTYTTNVFLLVKKIQATELAETNNLANLVRQINAGCDRYSRLNPTSQEATDLQQDIDSKIKKQNRCLNTILECREQYFNLDKGFTDEINAHISRSNRWFIFRLICCDWLKS